MECGETSDEDDDSRADLYLCGVLRTYYEEAACALERLRTIGDDKIPSHIKNALTMRWEQIKVLIGSAFQNGINSKTQFEMRHVFDAPIPNMD